MKRYILCAAFVLGLMGLGSRTAFAGPSNRSVCPQGTFMKKLGATATANGSVVSTAGQDVVAISWACTSSACSFALYNEDLPQTAALIWFEGGAAASGGDFIFLDQPLTFNTGISLGGSNLTGVNVYTCQQ